MSNRVIEQLEAVNPLPEPLPALPAERIRRLLDHEPAVPSRSARLRRRRTVPAAVAAAFAVAATAVLLVNVLPGKGGGFSVADARAAISRGEQRLSASASAVLYSKVAFDYTRPGVRPLRIVQQLWQGHDEMRATSSRPGGAVGLTDFASLGGISAYYVPKTNTVYLNRPEGAGPSSLRGGIPDPDPTELAVGVLLNVERLGVTRAASSFAGAFRQFMALPGAHIARHAGLVIVTARRGRHHSRMVAHVGSLDPVVISQSAPDLQQGGAEYTNTFRFIAYRRRISASQAAKAFDLLTVYPHAHVKVTHHQNLRLP